MNILIDIGHPAHVHLFKNFYFEMKKRGASLYVTVKDLPAAKELLKAYGMNFIEIGRKSDSLKGKLFSQFSFNRRLLQVVREKKIHLGLGSSITLAHVSKISRMKSFIFDDDDSVVEPLFARFAHPFADFLVSPDALAYERTKKNRLTYAGYHELAYLHPNRFTPAPDILKEVGLTPGEKHFVMRFNVFKAHHDAKVRGLTLEQKSELVALLEKKGRVFITTEREIEPEFRGYRLMLPPEKIHSLLYYADIFVGDSQTMTSEAALLGTPAVKCNSLAGKLSVPNEIENRYGLCYAFRPGEFPRLVEKVEEILHLPNLKEEWAGKKAKLLSEKIDVTAFMVWLIENYPASVEMMRKNPGYRYGFGFNPESDALSRHC